MLFACTRRGSPAACAAAIRIETYRQEFGIADPQRALGDEPGGVRQRSAEREARREIERARTELGRESFRDRSAAVSRTLSDR